MHAGAVVVGHVEVGDDGGAALAARDEADVRDSQLERGDQRAVLVAPVRGDDHGGVVVGRLDRAVGAGDDVVAERRAEVLQRERDRRVADDVQARGQAGAARGRSPARRRSGTGCAR